jgi:hypothetical protein
LWKNKETGIAAQLRTFARKCDKYKGGTAAGQTKKTACTRGLIKRALSK